MTSYLCETNGDEGRNTKLILNLKDL